MHTAESIVHSQVEETLYRRDLDSNSLLFKPRPIPF